MTCASITGQCKLVVLASLLAAILVPLTSASRDPYGTFHITLNQTNGSHETPDTEWLNMGYWEGASSFPAACKALALKTITAASCRPGGNVLDVGHGSGDSLLLYLRDTSIPRPSHLTGITSLGVHHKRSLERVKLAKATLTPGGTAVHVTLYCGDAVHRLSRSENDVHPLDPTSPLPPFTTITAIDCAYHFRTRAIFLRQSYVRLAEGGGIALADLCFSSQFTHPLSAGITRFLVKTLGLVPQDNMVTAEEYVQDMKTIGYLDVLVEDITKDVFSGLARYVSSRGLMWKVFAWGLLWLGTSARFIVVRGVKRTT